MRIKVRKHLVCVLEINSARNKIPYCVRGTCNSMNQRQCFNCASIFESINTKHDIDYIPIFLNRNWHMSEERCFGNGSRMEHYFWSFWPLASLKLNQSLAYIHQCTCQIHVYVSVNYRCVLIVCENYIIFNENGY